MAADTVVLEVSIFLVADDPVRAGCFLRVCFFVIVSKKLVFCHKLGSFHSSGW